MSQKSIRSFFSGGHKRKSEETGDNFTVTKKKKYDEEKRARKYQEIWKDTFPWVEYDEEKNIMTCNVCSKYPTITSRNKKNRFVDGCSTFRLDFLKSHHVSAVHRECQSYDRSSKKSTDTESSTPHTDVSDSGPIIRAFKSLDDKTLERLENLFITAFLIAKKAKPLCDFELHLELLKRLKVSVGDKYGNIPGAREFIKAIANSVRKEFTPGLQDANFVTIMSDGSTDTSVIEQETVFVRYVNNGTPVSFYAGIVALEHCHADGVLDGIKTAINNIGLPFENIINPEACGPKLVSVNFDGASVMLGHKGGVAAKIVMEAKHVVPVHCVAHKLELAVLDAVKQLPDLAAFEETLKQVFKFYHYSPKMRRELKEVANVFNTDLLHLSNVKQVRWLASKIRAVKAMHRSIHSILLHIESVATGQSDQSAKAKGWLQKMKNVSFLKTMYILLDILPILADVSLVFQKEELLITEVPVQLEGLILKLINLKQDPLEAGENMKKFTQLYNPDGRLFDSIKLQGRTPPVLFKEDAFLISFIDGITNYLDKRFACFNERPLKCFSLFDYTDWPTERVALAAFGKSELSQLLEHFSVLFSDDERKRIPQEFTELKAHMKGSKRPMFLSYQQLMMNRPERFVNICKLVELMFAISPATAICERLFSSMNLAKTSQRTLLNQQTLDHILTVMTHGPRTLNDFCPKAAIKEWISSAQGSRHILSMMKDPSIPVASTSGCSSASLSEK